MQVKYSIYISTCRTFQYIHATFMSSRLLGVKSQAFLDEVGHQDLRSLLILHQDIMRGSDLVSIKTIQQCDTDHSGWRETSDS